MRFLIILAVCFVGSVNAQVKYTGDLIATLDPSEEFRPGVSLFWSPTGQAAWDQLRGYHGVKEINLEPHTPVAQVLNNFQWDAAKTLPDGTVVFGGEDSNEFRERIRSELRRKVGANAAAMIGPFAPPGFVDNTTTRLGSALFVSCISHAPRFPASFRPSKAVFKHSGDKHPLVAGFGCQKSETTAHFDVVEIIADDFKGSYILKLTFFTGEKERPEFMLVGLRPGLKSLAEGVEWMKAGMKKPLPVDQAVQYNNAWWRYHNQLTPEDHFWMPKLKTTFSCDFGELIGKTYLRQPVPGGETFWKIREAQQMLSLRLDEHGVLAQAVFKIPPDFLMSGGGVAANAKPNDPTKLPFLPRSFLFNSPFIATLWMKGAEWPYLACWIDSESALTKQ
jgi:hypothetical protein